MDNFLEGLPAVLLWVLQLARQLGGAPALENHRLVRRRKMPLGMAGRHAFTNEVFVLMTVLALERVKPLAVGSALHILEMEMAVFALQWNVAGGMTIHAARVHEHRICGE